MMTFRHAGDRGDILASLPAVRHLCQYDKALFFIEAAQYTRELLTPENWLGIDKILRAQPYIAEVREWDRKSAGINLNDFRARLFKSMRIGANKDKALCDWILETHNVPLQAKDTAWLTVPEKKVAKVVFNRTGPGRQHFHVYHNPRFPWHRIWQKYRNDAVFVGTKDEHEVFCATCGDVTHYPTADLFEAAQVIAGCDLFVGNQSCCFWMAEGMKKRLILEIWPGGPNCLVFRPDAIHGWDQNISLPDL